MLLAARTARWLGLLVCVASCSQPLEKGDRDRVLTIEQLRPYGLRLPKNFAGYERIQRTNWFGVTKIEYEFDPPDKLGLPYLSSRAERYGTQTDACRSFSASNLGVRLVAEITERNDLFEFGDKSLFGLIVRGGKPIGNYFSMCRDKRTLFVMLGGFYFDDGETWAKMLKPALDAVARE